MAWHAVRSALAWSLLALPGVAGAQSPADARAVAVEMMNSNGGWVGAIEVRQLAHALLFAIELESLPPGGHGLHVHERGVCEPPDFETAEGHFNPAGKAHGFANEAGPHAGDLPNIHATVNGAVRAELVAPWLALEADGGERTFALGGDSGAAIVVHEGLDDYRSEPADTGARIACGVILEPEGGPA